MKNQSEISWQFPAHLPPQQLRNYNEQAKRISFQLGQKFLYFDLNSTEISADLFVYICYVIFEICARAEHHVIGTRGNSRFNKGQTFIKQAIPLKNIPTCWSTDISLLCRNSHFHWKGQCASEIQLLNTLLDQLRCHHGKQMTPVWRSSISHA